jgi:hypothetical protein
MPTVQPQQTIASLFNQTEQRCLEIFAESIKEADRSGSSKWGVTHYGNDRVRLNVGSIVVCTLHAGRIWFALDKAWQGSAECVFLDRSHDWKWTPGHDYVAVPSMSGFYAPSAAKAHTTTWTKIRKMHFALINKAASKYRKLRSSSKRAHSADFMNYLRQRLNDPTIPDP